MKQLFKLIFLFILFSSVSLSFAQAVYPKYPNFINCGSESEALKGISQKEIYIVKSGNQGCDDALSEAVKLYWKQSKEVKSIGSEELKGLLSDKNNYFISLVDFSHGPDYDKGMFIADYKKYRGNFVAVFTGGEKKLNVNLLIATLPTGENTGYTGIAWTVKAINEGVDYVIKNNLVDRKDALFGLLNESKKGSEVLKEKTLLINQSDIGKLDDLKMYNYKYEVKAPSEVYDLIKSGNKTYCMLTTCINYPLALKSIYIYDLENSVMVYGNFTMTNQPLYSADYIRLNNAIEGKQDK
ncbi:MAG: hypothetical protein K0S44_506 [Bacteroidetes bacterium]|jgi:hypothetical protein|nr:hypothetical protein [Bacteroidota bacterium]